MPILLGNRGYIFIEGNGKKRLPETIKTSKLMKVENFSSFESQVLTEINNGKNTFEALLNCVTFGEKTLSATLESLCSRSILKIDTKTKKYVYCIPLENNEMVILDGNILLPTTIIRVPEKGIMYVTRGAWYKFPIDFDIRRIIWNIKIVGKNNSTLVEMIRTSVLKERKTKIKHNPEYDNIRNKILPYSKSLEFVINAVGDEVTDITIRFRFYFDENNQENNQLSPIFRGFKVNSEISTAELLGELRKPVNERNYPENIKLNKIYNLSDFIFKDNKIPISFVDNVLKFMTIINTRKGFELTYYEMDMSGFEKRIDSVFYDKPDEAVKEIRDNFALASLILDKNGFLCEVSE